MVNELMVDGRSRGHIIGVPTLTSPSTQGYISDYYRKCGAY